MPKTPDEIKKGLERCSVEAMHCGPEDPKCSYDCGSEECIRNVMHDALAYIQQLEFQSGELLKTVEMLKAEIEEYEESADKCCYESRCNAELNKLEALCKQLMDENEQLKAERDALMVYVKSQCSACKFSDYSFTEDPCKSCFAAHRSKWEWRGVQKEE